MRLVYPFVPATAKEETEEELRRAMDASAEVEIVGSSFAPKSEGLQAAQREANFEGQDDIKDQAKAAGAAEVRIGAFLSEPDMRKEEVSLAAEGRAQC